jgi:hypothetical protein
MSETADAPDEIAVVADGIDEFIDKARYKMLFDARQEAAATLRELPAQQVAAHRNTRSSADADSYVASNFRAAVQAYIYEAEPLFKNTDAGGEKWDSAEIGPVPLRKCVPGVEWPTVDSFEAGQLPGTASIITDPTPALVLDGIRGYLDFDGAPVQIHKTEELDRRGNATKEASERHEIIPTPALSRQAFRITNDLLSELGIGLEAETEGDSEARADYSDVLDSDWEA